MRTGDTIASIILQQISQQCSRRAVRVVSYSLDCECHEVEHIARVVVLPDARKHGVKVKFAQCAAVVQVRRLKIQEMLKYLVTRHVHFHGRDCKRATVAASTFFPAPLAAGVSVETKKAPHRGALCDLSCLGCISTVAGNRPPTHCGQFRFQFLQGLSGAEALATVGLVNVNRNLASGSFAVNNVVGHGCLQ